MQRKISQCRVSGATTLGVIREQRFFSSWQDYKHVIHPAPFSVIFNNHFCQSLHWVQLSRCWQQGLQEPGLGEATAALCWLQPMCHRARLSAAAKQEHLWERGFEVGQKILHRQRRGGGGEVGSSHLTTKLKAGGGWGGAAGVTAEIPGSLRRNPHQQAGVSQQEPEPVEHPYWVYPKGLQLMKRSQAEAGAGTAEPTTAVVDWPPFPEKEAEESGVKVWSTGKGGWCFTVFYLLSHHAILIGNKSKSLLLLMVTGKHSSHLSQPMKFLFSSPASWGSRVNERPYGHTPHQFSTE